VRYFIKVLKSKSPKRWNGVQRRIGITGGIASGKSTIGKYVTSVKKIPILDADIYSHEALRTGTKATNAVIKRFGPIVSKETDSGLSINRLVLGDIIFSNANEKIWLENLLHPIIKKRFIDDLNKEKDLPIIGLMIPLLFEANLTYLCSEVWLVCCTINQQFDRLMYRDNLDFKQAKS